MTTFPSLVKCDLEPSAFAICAHAQEWDTAGGDRVTPLVVSKIDVKTYYIRRTKGTGTVDVAIHEIFKGCLQFDSVTIDPIES